MTNTSYPIQGQFSKASFQTLAIVIKPSQRVFHAIGTFPGVSRAFYHKDLHFSILHELAHHKPITQTYDLLQINDHLKHLHDSFL